MGYNYYSLLCCLLWLCHLQTLQLSHESHQPLYHCPLVLMSFWWMFQHICWTKVGIGDIPAGSFFQCHNIKRTHPKVCNSFCKNPRFPAFLIPGFHWPTYNSWTPPLMGEAAFYSHQQCTYFWCTIHITVTSQTVRNTPECGLYFIRRRKKKSVIIHPIPVVVAPWLQYRFLMSRLSLQSTPIICRFWAWLSNSLYQMLFESLYSASQKKQNPETKGCCDQVPGCMTVVIPLS